MIITIEELGKTSLYPEIIEEITRNDSTAVELQILAAEAMAKSYLFKYDLMALFGNATTPPTHPDELLKSIVKSIATYKLLLLANPNVHLDLFLADYKESIKLLCDIRDGKNNPQLPYAVDDPTTDTDESNQAVQWNSNVKRNNHG